MKRVHVTCVVCLANTRELCAFGCPCGQHHPVCLGCHPSTGLKWTVGERFPICPATDEAVLARELMA